MLSGMCIDIVQEKEGGGVFGKMNHSVSYLPDFKKMAFVLLILTQLVTGCDGGATRLVQAAVEGYEYKGYEGTVNYEDLEMVDAGKAKEIFPDLIEMPSLYGAEFYHYVVEGNYVYFFIYDSDSDTGIVRRFDVPDKDKALQIVFKGRFFRVSWFTYGGASNIQVDEFNYDVYQAWLSRQETGKKVETQEEGQKDGKQKNSGTISMVSAGEYEGSIDYHDLEIISTDAVKAVFPEFTGYGFAGTGLTLMDTGYGECGVKFSGEYGYLCMYLDDADTCTVSKFTLPAKDKILQICLDGVYLEVGWHTDKNGEATPYESYTYHNGYADAKKKRQNKSRSEENI